MNDNCPKCGAERDKTTLHYLRWQCGSYEPLGGMFTDSGFCLRNQLAAANAEKLTLAGQLSGLCGYAATCKHSNTYEWLDGLVRRINSALEAMNDDDRVRLIHVGNIWVIIPREQP